MIENRWLKQIDNADTSFWPMNRKNPQFQAYILIKNLANEPNQRLDLEKLKRRYRVWIESVKSELLANSNDKDDSLIMLKSALSDDKSISEEEGELPEEFNDKAQQ